MRFHFVLSLLLAVGIRAAPAPSYVDHRLNKRYVQHRNGVPHNVLEHRATGATMSYVTNSGICETTPGVNQYSGYLSFGDGKEFFFWFFEARQNKTAAPLVAWFNGGPACSSLIGLFQENGPCNFTYLPIDYDLYNHTSKPSLNPNSWNEYANMLYIDQPIGTGYSIGNETVTSTPEAAVDVWKILQVFLAEFPEFQGRDFGLWTESYGGHYGPEFTRYIQDQNKAISAGTLSSADFVTIPQVALGINNGWFDQRIQQKSYIDFSYQNPYKTLINATQRDALYQNYTECLPLLDKCETTKTDQDCYNADKQCYDLVEGAIANGPGQFFNVYDVRQTRPLYPPVTYTYYLQEDYVKKAIGVNMSYVECNDPPYYKMINTGDDARSSLSRLSEVVQSGMTVLLWAGDTDWICNWMGNLEVANNVSFPGQAEFREKELAPFIFNGTEMGAVKAVDNFTFLKVKEAGHTLPYWQPELALEVFKRTMQRKPIA